jgi:hypothetical protein
MIRAPLSLLFAAIIALTSVTLGYSQAAQVGAQHMVLCSADGGVTTITLDSQGNPLPEVSPCLDCILALYAQDLLHASGLPLPPLRLLAPIVSVEKPTFAPQVLVFAYARGPPVLL